MPKHILMLQSSAAEGRDEEFNDWYETVHIPEMMEVPGFVGATRFEAAPGMDGSLPVNRYLVIYDIEADELPPVFDALRGAAGSMNLSSAQDMSKSIMTTYRVISEHQTAN